MTARQLLAEHYLTVLTGRLGLNAHITDELDVLFEQYGLPVLLHNTAPSDPDFLCLTYAVGLPEDAPVNLVDQLAMQSTHTIKAVKALRVDDLLVLRTEMFIGQPHQLPDPHLVAAVIPRACQAIGAALKEVYDGLVLGQLEHDLTTDTSINT